MSASSTEAQSWRKWGGNGQGPQKEAEENREEAREGEEQGGGGAAGRTKSTGKRRGVRRSWGPEQIYYLQDINCGEEIAAGNPLSAS